MKTVNITDYAILSPTLAKVVISYTGEPNTEFLIDELAKKLDNQAAPVRASFKQIRAGVAVGFIRANKAVRTVSPNEINAGYRVMSSNVLMDKADNSLWEVKEGAAGKYLARHGQEDLTALVQATAQRRTDVPKLSHITIARAGARELVAFVDDEGDMDYGFAVATNAERAKILSFKRRVPVTVGYDHVVSIQPVAIPAHVHTQVVAGMTSEEKKNANAYWSKLYSWAPDYMRQVQTYVNQGTVA